MTKISAEVVKIPDSTIFESEVFIAAIEENLVFGKNETTRNVTVTIRRKEHIELDENATIDFSENV